MGSGPAISHPRSHPGERRPALYCSVGGSGHVRPPATTEACQGRSHREPRVLAPRLHPLPGLAERQRSVGAEPALRAGAARRGAEHPPGRRASRSAPPRPPGRRAEAALQPALGLAGSPKPEVAGPGAKTR